MIDRDKWAEIYDMARYNGFSPFRYLFGVIVEEGKDLVDDEEALFEACRKFSQSRTQWPTN
jgi:hypothetical protein